MSSKNALLFFLAVFGILFIGLDAALPVFGINGLSPAMSMIGAGMLVVFMILVLGIGFVLKTAYLAAAAFCVTKACDILFVTKGDLVTGLIFAGVSFVLLALIPTVFLKKK